MHAIVLLTFLCANFAEFFTKLGAPGVLKFLPEVFSGLIGLYVLLEGVRRGFHSVAPKYWAVFFIVAFLIVCGVLSNGVGSGPILAGSRFYFRAMPLFLLPAIAAFSDKQIQQQLKLMLGIALVQLPVACYQRWVILSQGRFSGDDVRGTVMDSGVLSILLICSALVLTGFFLHKRIPLTKYLVLFFLLLIPTMINETKATVILLPIGLFATVLAAAPPGRRLRITAWSAIMLAVFGAILVPVYDYMNANTPYKNERHLLDFFTSQKQMTEYMEAKKGTAAVGTTKQVRRGDAIAVPMAYLERDPIHLAFGLGIGNASFSTLGQNFVGDYNGLFRSFVFISFSVFLLEIGVLGTLLVFLLYWLVFRDAVFVAKSDQSTRAAIAAGWIGVVTVMAVATFYTNTHTFACLSYLYWYFSGVVAARRVELVTAQNRLGVPARNAEPPGTSRLHAGSL